MDSGDRHRFRVLMGLRKDYRELHDAARAVVSAWRGGDYEFLGCADPIHELGRVLGDPVHGALETAV